jgi:hypothetical protein
MMTVYKYLIGPGASGFQMPRGAKPLAVQMQGNEPMLWALVDPTAPLNWCEVYCYGTGHDIPDDPGEYVGTFQMAGGSLVWHAFARVPQ